MAYRIASIRSLVCAGTLLASWAVVCAQGAEPVDPQVRELADQNRRLQEQLREQQRLIDGLNSRLGDILKASERQESELQSLQTRADNPPAEAPRPARSAGEVRISGEAALAFFNTGSDGQFPHAEFRVDEAKVFLEAPVWKNAYFFGGLDLVTREAGDEYFHLGELYLEFENVSGLWHQDHLLSVRAGRFYIPFGEEYQVRGVMDDPLISHSVSDIWGIDEGVELYGEVGRVRYVFAVQNGGIETLHDDNADKALAARISFDPAPWLKLSASAMRTGDLTVAGDGLSAVWFGGGFFQALGPPATTRLFSASLGELDGSIHWKTGHLSAAVGWVKFDDNNRPAGDSRHLRYGSVEAVQQLGEGFYGAVRFSQIHAPGGYPLVGQGDFTEYFLPGELTSNLERLSLGLGYRFAPPLVWKVEYNFENGRLVNGEHRGQENLLSTELALKF
jgi:hypothetical protein